MQGDELFLVGKIQKTFGNQGQLMVHLEPEFDGTNLVLKSVFLETEGERIPFFIESWLPKPGNKALVRFDDIPDMASAARLTGCSIYVPLSALPELPEDEFYFHEIIGFTVKDSKYGIIGKISDVLDLPQQTLLQVLYGEKEILIPLVDEIVTGMDKKKKLIFIDAPEGLISLYVD